MKIVDELDKIFVKKHPKEVYFDKRINILEKAMIKMRKEVNKDKDIKRKLKRVEKSIKDLYGYAQEDADNINKLITKS